MSDHDRARTFYRLLLHAYPKAYRERYGYEMEEAFIALLRLDERHGAFGRARCWIGATWDASIQGTAARLGWSQKGRTGGVGEMMGSIVADVHYALRSLRRQPVFAATAIVTIALGIGANASVFTVVDGFMFTPLPYEDSDELVAIWSAKPSLGWDGTDVNPADAWDWRERVPSFSDLAVFNADGLNLTGGDIPELVSAVRTTPNLLRVLGRPPVIGRDFDDDEVGEGRDGVAILTDGFWQRRFARSPDALGSTMTLDGRQFVVIGIMPRDFLFFNDPPDMFLPWAVDPATAERDGHYANAIARLVPGATVDQAQRDLRAVSEQLETEHTENEGWTADVVSLREDVIGEVAKQASIVLLGAVGFILLMACVNVANLLLARAGGRSREMAVRIALGADRRRVIRQLLTESMVIAGVGGALGLVGAYWGYRGIVSAMPSDIPPVFQFGMDSSVLVFTLSITAGAALLFGVLPAFRTSSAGGAHLRDAARTSISRGASRFGSALVILQTAMAVVLLVGGGLLMKSIAGMRTQDYGFQPENVLTVRVALPAEQYDSRELSDAFWADVTSRVEELPGVVAVGTTQGHPLMGSNWGGTVRIAGHDTGEETGRSVRLTYASPGLFEALGFTMARGRTLTQADATDAQRVTVVNETFVRRYLSQGEDPLRTTLLGSEDSTIQIVGVVEDVIERGVDEAVQPALYLPIDQGDIRTRSLVVSTETEPTDFVSAIQEAVWAVDGNLPLYNIETMDALLERRIGGFAIIGNLMGIFALLSLVLGAVGIYGVTAYSAGQRTSEIGVRLAMGARPGDVVRMVVSQGAKRAVFGLVIGLGLAFAMGGAMSGILIGVSPTDPAIFGGVTFVLAAVSFVGLYLPAQRVSRTDPVQALSAD